MYHSRVTRTPRSVEAIIWSTVLRIFRSAEHDVHGRFAHFVGQREIHGRSASIGPTLIFVLRLLHLFRGGAGINQSLDHSIFDQLHALARHAFPVDRESRIAADERHRPRC